jgi:hypothetical protein
MSFAKNEVQNFHSFFVVYGKLGLPEKKGLCGSCESCCNGDGFYRKGCTHQHF